MGVSISTGFAAIGMAEIYFKVNSFYVFLLLPVYVGFMATTLYGRTNKSDVFLNTFLVLLLMCLPFIAFTFLGFVFLIITFPFSYFLALIGSLFGMGTWRKPNKISVRFQSN